MKTTLKLTKVLQNFGLKKCHLIFSEYTVSQQIVSPDYNEDPKKSGMGQNFLTYKNINKKYNR